MFALDRSLHFVEAAERDVVAIFRSVAAVTISPPGAKTMSSEAFICIVQRNDRPVAYIALAEAGNKNILIFAREKECLGSESKGSDDQLEDALTFTGSMGFTMEPVNLAYGRALREVVVRSLRVISDPENGNKLALEKHTPAVKPAVFNPSPVQQLARKESAGTGSAVGKKESLTAEKCTEKTSTGKAKAGVSPQKAVATNLPDFKRNAKAKQHLLQEPERERLVAEKRAAEAWAEEQAEIARQALLEVEAGRERHKTLLEEKAAAEKRASKESEAARHAHEMIQVERMERERILAEKVAAEKRAEEQAEIARHAQKEAQAERAEREKLVKEKEEVERRVAGELEMEWRITRERIEAERIAQENLAARTAAAELAKEARLAEEILEEKLLQSESARLVLKRSEADRAECEAVAADKAEAERQAVAASEGARLAYEKAENEFSAVETQLEELNSTEKKLAELVESERAAWERVEAERVESELLLAEKVARQQAAEEKVAAAKAALAKAEAERAEQETILAGRAAAEISAAERIESAHSAWEKAEAARVQLEKTLKERADCRTRAGERADKARRHVGQAVAERVESEKLLQEKREAEKRAKELAESGVKATKGGADPGPDNSTAVAGQMPLGQGEAAQVDGGKPAAGDRIGETGSSAAVMGPASAGESAIEQSVQQLLKTRGALHHNEIEAASPVPTPASTSSSIPQTGSPFFDSGESAPAINFTIDDSLSLIDFHEYEQISYLHQSLNTVRLTIAGFPSQNCAAYLCAIEKEGAFAVFFGVHLTESSKNIIYRSERVAATPGECEDFILDGIRFAETVGYMMDRVEGGDTSLERTIEAIPVLNRTDAAAG